jgi:macrolide-specific efflux system membrane fusion protein
MQMVVPFSETDIVKVRVGQPATVTVNAIPGTELAARVSSISILPTSTSGVVSYDTTLTLSQKAAGLRAGMSATAAVIISQAEGAVTVPSGAISRSAGGTTVTVVRSGKSVVQPVVTGVVGDSTTQILSGVSAGEQIEVPIVTPALSNSSTTGAGAGRFGAGAAFALGGGGGVFGRGGGGGGGGGFARALGGG